MSFKIESFIARRYLKGAEGRSEGRRFLKLVTFISIGGVAVGVATLILALSIVRGFSQEIRSKVIGFGAHVQIESIRDAPLEDYSEVLAALSTVEGIESIAPVIQEFVLLRRSSTNIEGVSIWGTEEVPGYIANSMSEGAPALGPDSIGRPGIVIGKKLSKLISAQVGSTLTAFSVNTGSDASNYSPPRLAQFVVQGIYETSLANFDELYVFVALDRAVMLLDYKPDQVTRIDVRIQDGIDYSAAANLIDEKLEFPAIARPITDVYRSLFSWVKLQESIIPLVISIIVFVASINIIGTLLMIILEKTSEMGVLASLGATAKMRRSIFVHLGLYVGISGVIIGETLAFVFALIQLKFEVIPLPAEAYYMKYAPIELSLVDFVLVAAVTLILCAISSYIPARYAARILPLKAIRSR
jgi:lipoprotein-releasing system permease protein